LPAASAAAPVADRIDFPSGETIIVRPATAGDRLRPAENLRLAVVLGGSRSMARHGDEITAAFARLATLRGELNCLEMLAVAEREAGDVAAARQYLEQMWELSRAKGHLYDEGWRGTESAKCWPGRGATARPATT
jgi:hypothetical protein